MARKAAAQPPREIDLSDLQLHAGQVLMVESMRKYTVTCNSAARRWGKTKGRFALIIDQVARSNGWIEGCCGAQSHAEAKNLFEIDLLAFGGPAGTPGTQVKDSANEDQRRFIDLWPMVDDEARAEGFDNDGARLWYPSLGPDHGQFQGHGLQFAILDEMSLIGPGAWTDTIEPMLGDTGGHAMLYGAAYPEGPNFAGWSELWQRGNPKNDDRDPDWFSMTGASWDNPYVDAKALKKQYEAMVKSGQAAKARCLYLGEFVTDLGAVFTNLDAVFVLRHFKEIEQDLWIGRDLHPNESVVISIDFGRHDDATVVMVFSRQTMEMVALLRIKRTEYLHQLPMIDRLIRRFPLRQIWAEGREEAAAELLRRMYGDACNLIKWTSGGVYDKNTSVAKGMDYFQRAAWRMFDLPWLKEEFRLFERKKLPSGIWKYAAPEGRHDDSVAAALYAAYGLPLLAESVPNSDDGFRRDAPLAPWVFRKPESARRFPFLLRNRA